MYGFVDALFEKIIAFERNGDIWNLKMIGYTVGSPDSFENIHNRKNDLKKRLGNIIIDLYSSVC